MPLLFRINGSRLETEDQTTSDRVFLELERQGWQIDSVSVDGEVASDRSSLALDIDSLVEITAKPPADAPSSSDKLRAEILASLSAFHEHAERLGDAFAKGQWANSLDDLQRYLDDFEVILSGIQAFPELKQMHADLVNRVPALLVELGDAVNRQSWVEVSDLLLYEVSPLIKEWQD